jgi:hypothetical protein
MNLYKKRFPRKTLHGQTVDILRLNPTEWANFKGIARHWLGEEVFHDALPRHPSNKILPSSLETIKDVDSQNTLAALMHVENHAHRDKNQEFHEGGGIRETAQSILGSLWNLIGFGPEFDSLFETLGWSGPVNRATAEDALYAAITNETYKAIEDRKGHLGAWDRLPRFDSDKLSAWLDRDEQRVHIAVKGTSTAADIISDLHILGGNTSGHEKEVMAEIKHVIVGYGNNFTYDIAGHSLGATEIMNVTREDDFALDKLTDIYLFNPGITPTHGLDNAKDAMKDDRVHIFLNSGDLLSNGMVSLVNSDTNVAWSKPTHSFGGNHGLAQWQTEV